jgi:predicted rRNA methylase YqxC with S4 and FtsJ domains
VEGRVCLDVGASTSASLPLLQRRAGCAVDVSADSRLEVAHRSSCDGARGINARYLKAGAIAEPVDLIVCDVALSP